MGSAVTVGVSKAVKESSDEEVQQALRELSAESREKLLAALRAAEPVIPAVEGKPGGKTLLVVMSSPMGARSATNTVGKAFCKAYAEKHPDDTIKVLDTATLPAFTAARVQAKFKLFGGDAGAADDSEEWMVTKKLCQEFAAADKFVFLAPMWNFWIPHSLKLYIDHIVQPALTFDPAAFKGLVTGKPALVVRAAGGVPVGSDMDLGTRYMKAVLGFIGFTDVRVLGVTGTADPSGLPKLLEEKSKEAAELVATFDFDAEAKNEPGSADLALADQEPAEVKEGAKVLFVTSSPMGEHSLTLGAGKTFVKELEEKCKATVTTVDLSDGKTAPFTAARVQAKFATWGGGKDAAAAMKEWETTTALIDQMREHDVYVFAVPMWNLAIPNQLKLWFDHVVQPHQTFNPATNGGLLEGKRAFVFAASSGGLLGTPMDHVTPFMKQALGFMGVADVGFSFLKGKDDTEAAVSKLKAAVKL